MQHLIKNFQLNDPFWTRYEHLIKETVIPYQEKALRDEIPDADKSHAIANFQAATDYLKTGVKPTDFYGMVFQDSDVAKWLEAVAYTLILFPDAELEARADEIISLIGSAQQKDGYLNTYFTLNDDKAHFSNLHEAHELYCAGHMMEAAVAYFESTGKRSLLDIMLRMTDCIYRHFIVDQAEGYPGHPEVELALMRMYHATGDQKCLKLAEHFINVRGVDPHFYEKERAKIDWTVWNNDPTNYEYEQNYAPVREQDRATGHSVRAVYLYTGMAALAQETKDASLLNACKRLWNSITEKQMYVTGGIGSTCLGEAFTTAYHLPNDTAYAETCASIGLIFFARKMLALDPDSQYANVMERALYNCVLAGMQLNGTRFFYVNPLEAEPGVSGVAPTHKHTLPERPQWFGCACCPPNIARLLPSIAEYAWSETADTLYSHLYLAGDLKLEQKNTLIHVTSEYPYEGKVKYQVEPLTDSAEFTLAIRIPDWSRHTDITLNGISIFKDNCLCNAGSPDASSASANSTGSADSVCSADSVNSAYTVEYNKGYLYIHRTFIKGDVIELSMDMAPYRIYANTAVSADSGRVAFARGPLVYCAEGIDNDSDVFSLSADSEASIKVLPYDASKLCGIVPMEVGGCQMKSADTLYSQSRPEKTPYSIHLIPYYTWCNRGLNQMRVWLPESGLIHFDK